jgi:hypothetical protein
LDAVILFKSHQWAETSGYQGISCSFTLLGCCLSKPDGKGRQAAFDMQTFVGLALVVKGLADGK